MAQQQLHRLHLGPRVRAPRLGGRAPLALLLLLAQSKQIIVSLSPDFSLAFLETFQKLEGSNVANKVGKLR